MSDPPDDGVRSDDEGWLRVDLTRRSVLGTITTGTAAAVAASLGAGQDSSDGVVDGPQSTVGGQSRVPSSDLALTGTMRAVFVAIHPAQFPADPPTPALGYALEGGPRMAPGSPPYAETETTATNLAEIHVVDDPSTVSLDRSPALIISRQQPGVQLAVDGDRHQRSAVDGAVARVHGGQDQADLPSTLGSTETPALGVSRQNGLRVWL